ncbi:O-fucosyltransferase family protein [Rhynchospora pubera]|uniref:O-fucosyltransferase family protein n=1 Tax=Rhynchospora pubera TaxID=906938 RepID=A0AAV8D389_9POAL|nr:O-fucosyltransferase family protein [Rhynchospora pubera]
MAFPDDPSPSTSSSPSPRTSPRGFGFVSQPSRLSVSSSSSPSSPSGSALALSRFAPRLMQSQSQPAKRKKSSLLVAQRWRRKGFLIWTALLAFFFLMNWWMFSRLQDPTLHPSRTAFHFHFLRTTTTTITKHHLHNFTTRNTPHNVMLSRLRALAAHALAEAVRKPEPLDLWRETLEPATSWKPCAHHRSWEHIEGNNGYILVSANGGINQQRVAICNAVAIARLLNATLVIPKFLYNSVWKDVSQFSDIYQEEYFINYLKDDVRIVKELPVQLQSLDLEAIGSLVTDSEVMKEAKPSFYVKKILPILLKNGVVHFIGFGNRLSFDPVPFELQRLRCKCNFHALRFVEKIQEMGALLVKRMHGNRVNASLLERSLLGHFAEQPIKVKAKKNKPSKYLAVHLRFEMDMAAYSMCYFGGGKEEEEELEAYREVHFPALTHLRKTTKVPSAEFLRSEGQCPLTPEEAVLMLAALGFKRSTQVYIAGAKIYGGKSRMAAIKHLYPRIATKETLLSASEIEPFRNFSSQLAALDFIACVASDAFAMTDSGSQLSSLVQGYRMYYGEGNLPSIRPNKRRLASIFSRNATIEWKEFESRVRKLIRQTKQVNERPLARSVYRHPRCTECMCKIEKMTSR